MIATSTIRQPLRQPRPVASGFSEAMENVSTPPVRATSAAPDGQKKTLKKSQSYTKARGSGDCAHTTQPFPASWAPAECDEENGSPIGVLNSTHDSNPELGTWEEKSTAICGTLTGDSEIEVVPAISSTTRIASGTVAVGFTENGDDLESGQPESNGTKASATNTLEQISFAKATICALSSMAAKNGMEKVAEQVAATGPASNSADIVTSQLSMGKDGEAKAAKQSEGSRHTDQKCPNQLHDKRSGDNVAGDSHSQSCPSDARVLKTDAPRDVISTTQSGAAHVEIQSTKPEEFTNVLDPTAQGDETQSGGTTEPRVLPADSTQSSQVVNSAHLIQRMSSAEMKVGMHSTEFGNVAIKTSVAHEQLAVQISVEHSELGDAISRHLPLLHAKLTTAEAVNAQIEIHSTSASFTDGRNGHSHNQQSHQSHRATQSGNLAVDSMEAMPVQIPGPITTSDRLDIRV